MTRASSDKYTRIERRLVGGREVRVRLDPDRIHVAWRPNRAAYVAVDVGDVVRDAASDIEATLVDEWRVTDITPDRVVGEHVRTGERREWDRAELERGLVLGNYSTNLTDFELVTVHRVGSWAEYDPEASGGLAYRGRPYVTVVAYGDNGLKYGRRYAFAAEGDDATLELAAEDAAVERLDARVRTRFDEVVRDALSDDGYVVRGGEPNAAGEGPAAERRRDARIA